MARPLTVAGIFAHPDDEIRCLGTLLRLHAGAGLLRYPPTARAAAQLFWAYGPDQQAKALWTRRAASLTRTTGATSRNTRLMPTIATSAAGSRRRTLRA